MRAPPRVAGEGVVVEKGAVVRWRSWGTGKFGSQIRGEDVVLRREYRENGVRRTGSVDVIAVDGQSGSAAGFS